MLNNNQISEVPQHIAIIMDGNGRWAKQNGQERLYGHMAGVEAVRKTVKAAAAFGVKYLTLYAFSLENWNRPKEEVDGLMNLLVDTLVEEIDALYDDGVRLQTIGNTAGLPESCQNTLIKAIEKTKTNNRITLVLALNYGSRWEITNAVQEIARKVKNHEIELNTIDDACISGHMTTADMPDPELIIRTSGEHRLSNFLLWQSSYAELYFAEVLWPDFDKTHLAQAISNYQSRERRFGMVSEQIK